MGDVERLWTHKETARYLHVSAWTLTELVRLNSGPTMFRVGRNRRYDPVDVLCWLQENAIGLPAQATSAGRHVRRDPIGESPAAGAGLGRAGSGASGPVTR